MKTKKPNYIDRLFTADGMESKGEALSALLLHCERYCSDREVARDFDAVTSIARPEDLAALVAYRRARMRASAFDGRSYKANSHRSIPAPVLRGLHELAAARESTSTMRFLAECTCQGCGLSFTARKASAAWCSAGCKKRAQRAAA